MRYINKRDEFLKKSLTKINVYNKIQLDDYKLINEEMESGPFANDIPWGDSILGRMINSAIRKAKIGARLLNINRVINQLKRSMDDIIDNSKANTALNEEEKKKLEKIVVYKFLQELQNSVEKGYRVKTIKSLTDEAISNVKKFMDFEKKEDLIKKLEDFRKFLDKFGDEEKKAEVKEEKSPYKSYLENFKSVYIIVQEYAKVKASFKPETSGGLITMDNVEVGKEYIYNKSKVVKILSKGHTAKSAGDNGIWDGEKIKDDEFNNVKLEPGYVLVVNKGKLGYKSMDTGPKGTYAAKVSLLSPLTEPNQSTSNVKKTGTEAESTQNYSTQNSSYSFINEWHSEKEKTQDPKAQDPKILVLKPIKSLYDYFNQDKGSTIKDLDAFFKAGDDYKNNPRLKDPIIKIYKQIKLKGGIKESAINDFLSRPEAIGDKIFDLYQTTKIKEGGEFEGINDSMKKAIAEFNRTMKPILTSTEPKKEEPTEEAKPEEAKPEEKGALMGKVEDEHRVRTGEKLFTKYSDFMKIYEVELVGGDIDMTTAGGKEEEPDGDTNAQDNKEEEPEGDINAPDDKEELEKPEISQEIKDYWKKLDLSDYKVEVKEIEEVGNLNEKVENTKQESCTINGIDPIMQIVKCFNRAYKLHTTQVIETGRHGGAVSNSVFMEYNCFGNGSPANAGSGGGPYRNIPTFNKWESAVLDIMGDSKYKPVFNEGTKIIKKEGAEDKVIDGVGKNLAKFMNRLLDGEELYKSDGGKGAGAQYKFLKEYFGYTETDGNVGFTNREVDTNKNNSNVIKTKKLEFKQGIIVEGTDIKGTFFAVKAKNGDKEIKKYFYIQESSKDNNTIYVICCAKFGWMKEWIKSSGIEASIGPPDFIKGSFDKNIAGKADQAILMAFKTTWSEFKKMAKNKKIKIDYIKRHTGVANSSTQGYKEDNMNEIIIDEIYTLCEGEGSYKLTKPKVTTLIFQKIIEDLNTNGKTKLTIS